MVSGQHLRMSGVAHTAGLGVAAKTTFESLGWAIRDITNRRRLKKLIKSAGDPVSIMSAADGVVRVEGRVEVLEPVSAPEGETLGAYIRRGIEDAPCGCEKQCTAVFRTVGTHRAAGRFVVRDSSGAAIVAGPRLRLLDYHGREIDPFETGLLAVRDGDTVTVVGEVRHEAVDDPRVRVTDGYRGVKLTPVFHGDDDTPVHVFCEADL